MWYRGGYLDLREIKEEEARGGSYNELHKVYSPPNAI
jgi:hypothetical protein